MTIQEVTRRIDEYGGHSPFILTITKADGSLRDMVAMKRNVQRSQTGAAKEGTQFKYSLKEKGAILLNELHGFEMQKVENSGSTHTKLKTKIDPDQITLRKNHRTHPKSIKVFSIQSYNGIPVQHV